MTILRILRFSFAYRLRRQILCLTIYKSEVIPIYGYKRTADGGLEIIPVEAEVVKQIYGLFLDGMGIHKIARELNEHGIKSNSSESWTEKKVRYILSNEKYIGDLLLQKSFSTDHLTKKRKKNRGEKPQYYVENNHEPIVSKEVYEAVQLTTHRYYISVVIKKLS